MASDQDFSVRARVAYSEEDLDQQAQAYVSPNASVAVPASALATPPNALTAAVRCEPVFNTNAGQPPDGIYCDTPVSVFSGEIPDGDDLRVRLSPNGLAGGGDLPGSELEVMRGSLLLNWSLDAGTITSRTGYTDSDTRIFNDRDKFAIQVTAST